MGRGNRDGGGLRSIRIRGSECTEADGGGGDRGDHMVRYGRRPRTAQNGARRYGGTGHLLACPPYPPATVLRAAFRGAAVPDFQSRGEAERSASDPRPGDDGNLGQLSWWLGGRSRGLRSMVCDDHTARARVSARGGRGHRTGGGRGDPAQPLRRWYVEIRRIDCSHRSTDDFRLAAVVHDASLDV